MLSNNLRVELAKKNMTTTQLFELTGVSSSTLSHLKNDKTDVKLSTLLKICTALKIRLSDLIEFVPE